MLTDTAVSDVIEITVEPCDGKTFRIIEGGWTLLVLDKDFASMSLKGWVENEPDRKQDTDEIEDLISGAKEWRRREVDFRHFCMKRNVAGVEMFWALKDEFWIVSILISGSQRDWDMYFISRSEAAEVQMKILKWLLS